MRRVDQPESNLINEHIKFILLWSNSETFFLSLVQLWPGQVSICKAEKILSPLLLYCVQTLYFHFHLQRYSIYWIIIKMTAQWETTLYLWTSWSESNSSNLQLCPPRTDAELSNPCDCCSASGDKINKINVLQIKHKCFRWHHWLNARGFSLCAWIVGLGLLGWVT